MRSTHHNRLLRRQAFISLVTTIALGSAAYPALAQPSPPPPEWFEAEKEHGYWAALGIKAGPSLANFRGEAGEGSERTRGLSVGVYAAYRVHEYARVQSEFIYATTGGTTQGPNYARADIDGESLFEQTYLRPTLLVQLRLPVGSRASVLPYAGGSWSWLHSASMENNGVTRDIGGVTSPLDLGLVAGASIEVDLGRGHVTIDLRLDLGMSSIDDSTYDEPADLRNQAVALMLGYSVL